MKHYGPEPPWRYERNYGRWVWVPSSLDNWFEQPGYWELRPPRSVSVRMLDSFSRMYVPVIIRELNKALLFDLVIGKPLPKSDAAEAAE